MLSVSPKFLRSLFRPIRLAESSLNHIRDLLAQNLRTFFSEVHISWLLEGVQFRQHQLMQIIHLNVVGPNDAQGGGIVSRGILRQAKGYNPGGERRCGGEDQFGLGGLELLDESLEVRGVGFQIGLAGRWDRWNFPRLLVSHVSGRAAPS